MSSLGDYCAASNNSVNENHVNARKARSTLHQLKKLLKALLRRGAGAPKKAAAEDAPRGEAGDNLANELLEARILEDMEECRCGLDAVPVFRDGYMEVVPVLRGRRYVPVHFAKTEAGTFFWTTAATADSDVCYRSNVFTGGQEPEVQAPGDRWAQA